MPATVILVDALPAGGVGMFAHYEHHPTCSPDWRFCDIRAIVIEHQDHWLRELDEWIQKVSAAGSAVSWHWWLLPAARFMIWLPVNLKPLLFTLGLIEYFRRNPSVPLHVVGVPQEVRTYLGEWQSQFAGDRPVVIDRRRRGPLAAIREQLGPRGIAILATGLRLRSLIVPMLRRRRTAMLAQADVLVISHTLSHAVVARFGDHYFGRVFDNAAIPTLRTHWFYHLSRFEEGAAIRGVCESIGRSMQFDIDWLRWRDVFAAAGQAVWTSWRFRKPFPAMPVTSVGGLKSASFLRRYLRQGAAFYPPVAELAAFAAVKNCLAAVRPRVVVYPFEQKGIERGMLIACGSQPDRVRSVGFAHAAFSTGHRYFRYAPQAGEPLPDAIAVTGPASLRWLHEQAGWPADRLRHFGSPRSPVPVPPLRRERSTAMRVLMITGFGTELELLATYAEARSDLFDGCELIVRRYPYAWHDAQQRGLDRLARLGFPMVVSDDPLDAQIADADVVLFCSTSAGLEAMLSGRVTIRVGLDDIVNGDPTAARGDNGAMLRADSADELHNHLRSVAAATETALADLINRQQAFARAIYAPVDPEAIAAMLREPMGQ